MHNTDNKVRADEGQGVTAVLFCRGVGCETWLVTFAGRGAVHVISECLLWGGDRVENVADLRKRTDIVEGCRKLHAEKF